MSGDKKKREKDKSKFENSYVVLSEENEKENNKEDVSVKEMLNI